jgi:hypothetical protein
MTVRSREEENRWKTTSPEACASGLGCLKGRGGRYGAPLSESGESTTRADKLGRHIVARLIVRLIVIVGPLTGVAAKLQRRGKNDKRYFIVVNVLGA